VVSLKSMNNANFSFRKAHRYETNERVIVTPIGAQKALSSRLKNLSHSGACIEIKTGNHSFRSGDLVALTILLSKVEKTHYLSAEVVWVRENQLGLRFVFWHQFKSKVLGQPRLSLQ